MLHLNDHLYSKSCIFLWVANFQGLTAGFASFSTLSQAFIVGYICITKNIRDFTRGGIYPHLLLPDTYFHFHLYNRETLLDVVPLYQVHHQTPNELLIHTMYSHPFHAMSLCICNAMCHFMPIPCHIFDECYMDNSTHAYHLCIMEIISISIKFPNDHTFHVNIFAHTYININKSSPIKQ